MNTPNLLFVKGNAFPRLDMEKMYGYHIKVGDRFH